MKTKTIKAPFKIRLLNSLNGVKHVAKKPSYILLAVVMSFILSGFVIWSLNFDLVKYIVVDAPITVFEKIRFFWDVQTGIYTAYSSSQATGIILFGIFFGINTALIVNVIKTGRLKQIPKKSGGAGLVFAMLSGGCVACGTSVLAPLLATLGATSSVFTSQLSNYLNWISIILISYSIFKLGEVISNTNDLKKTEEK
ncbi:MAG: hypothetical protein ACI9T8_000658 [Candidatus Saccharimonadales bacterium]|jgi:hypothetical protein